MNENYSLIGVRSCHLEMGIDCLLKHAAFRLNAASFCRWVGTKVLTDMSEKTVVFIIYIDQTL
jgi:hypothetical protein